MKAANNTCYGYLLSDDMHGKWIPVTDGSTLNYYIDQNKPELSNIRIKINGSRVYISNVHLSAPLYINGAQIIDAVLNNGDVISACDNKLFFFTKKINVSAAQSDNILWQKELSLLPGYAVTKHPVLLSGESGVGKDVLAKFIHKMSRRNRQPYVSINCSTLTDNMIESELFGHKKGSFTGSVCDRKGAFLSAKGGTLFLDEISDLPMHLQPKLLRALENNEIKPLGEDISIKTNVRVISATNRNLTDLVRKQKFRSDLFFRLNVIHVKIPPLRYRREDIKPLLSNFCASKKVKFNDCAINALEQYYWPGNVRELKNFVFRTSTTFYNKTVYEHNLTSLLELSNAGFNKYGFGYNSDQFEQVEKDTMIEILKRNNGDVTSSADEFKISKSKFYYKLRKWNIKPKMFGSQSHRTVSDVRA